jgi:hypothetical protein
LHLPCSATISGFCLQAQPKHLGSFLLSGPVLAGLTEAYVQAINDGAVPTIATAWQVCCCADLLVLYASGLFSCNTL